MEGEEREKGRRRRRRRRERSADRRIKMIDKQAYGTRRNRSDCVLPERERARMESFKKIQKAKYCLSM